MTGCVIIHGFTGSPHEVEPLAEYLSQYDWEISTPTLAGHGDSTLSMKDVGWNDWVFTAEHSVKTLCKKCETVYLVGFSMGGLIAAYLSLRYPIQRQVLLSPSVYYMNPKQLFQDLAGIIKHNFSHYSGKETFRRYMDKVSGTPLRSVAHFRRLVNVLKPKLNEVTVPTLVIQGECDDLVDPKSAQYVYDQIQSKEKAIHYLKNSKHIVCHDRDREELLERVDRFLNVQTVQM